MLNFFKKLIVSLDNYCKNAIIVIRMWLEFFQDLVQFKGKEFYLFSNQSWHYGWDYEFRKATYKKIFKEEINCVSLDFNNKVMVYIFKAFLKNKNIGESVQTYPTFSKEKLEIFQRNFWDYNCNKGGSFPTNTSSSYFQLYKKWCDKISFSTCKMINAGDYIFKCSTFRGLIVSQFGYEDWAWASLALLHRRNVFSPEANFGFTKLTGPIEIQETNFIVNESKNLGFSILKKGINSLSARCDGNFADSAISYYMSDIEFNNNNLEVDDTYKYVFYLHAFGDSPNNTISDYSSTFGIDYFHSTLKLLEEFNSRKIKVLIKLHPLSKQYNYDHFCLQVIDEFVKSSLYIDYCPDFPLNLFKFYLPNASIITGRGSIISEACYIGINSYSFCRSVYTELGMSKYFKDLNEVLEHSGFNRNEFKLIRKWSILLESVRLKKCGSSIYSLSNYSKESKLINIEDSLVGFLRSDRVVRL